VWPAEFVLIANRESALLCLRPGCRGRASENGPPTSFARTHTRRHLNPESCSRYAHAFFKPGRLNRLPEPIFKSLHGVVETRLSAGWLLMDALNAHMPVAANSPATYPGFPGDEWRGVCGTPLFRTLVMVVLQ